MKQLTDDMRNDYLLVQTGCALFLICLGLLSSGCSPPPAARGEDFAEMCLVRTAEYHGGAGPWAVVGYRVGVRALEELDVPRHARSLFVTHRAPLEVQYSCIADGVQAATGASPGKLSLVIQEAPAEQLQTIVEDRHNGRRIIFQLRPEFVESIRDLHMARLRAEGQRVAALADEEIFTFTVEDIPAVGDAEEPVTAH